MIGRAAESRNCDRLDPGRAPLREPRSKSAVPSRRGNGYDAHCDKVTRNACLATKPPRRAGNSPSNFAEAFARLGGDGDGLAIHCLDLDRFKTVNDAYGHLVGDALLRAVTERLLGAIRRKDTAARLGGDEFVVVQSGIRHEDEALLIAHRIIRALGAPYEVGGKEIRIGVSIGVALAPRDGLALDGLIARADAALYRAKRDGRGVAMLSDEAEPPSSLTGP